jgi:hypothetical protein
LAVFDMLEPLCRQTGCQRPGTTHSSPRERCAPTAPPRFVSP